MGKGNLETFSNNDCKNWEQRSGGISLTKKLAQPETRFYVLFGSVIGSVAGLAAYMKDWI
ncbi:hypothetical protein AF332_00325 [Sporosarcina globispora]|uniref:Uncharacterized protein n=1 Tax=Sporosarcina globispora TaxID=1459 RepID=A0A0M0G7J1_SPOGL|nr:hypothetical protein [Sporosarcina globispora]KON85467.1 hypothetical protein AF332_00325 [Sporosarcina globispora]